MLFQVSIGVDITAAQVRLICVRASFGGVRVFASAEYKLDGQTPLREQAERVREIVEEFMRRNKLASAEIHLGFPSELTVMKAIDFPQAVKENLDDTLRYEMEKYVPLPAEELYSDYKAVESNGDANRLRVNLTIGRKQDLHPFVEIASKIGGGVSSFDVFPLPLISLLDHKKLIDINRNVIFLYCDHNKIKCWRLFKGVPDLSKVLPWRSIADEEKTIDDLRHTINVWAKRSDTEPDSEQEFNSDVYCCGPALNENFCVKLEDRLGIAVQSIALEKINIKHWDQVTAFALALKGIRKVPVECNLLPYRDRKRPSRFKYYVMAACFITLVLAGSLWGGGVWIRKQQAQELLDAEISRLSSQALGIDAIEGQVNKLRAQIDYLDSLRQANLRPLNALKELSRIVPASAWVNNFHLSEDELKIDGYAESSSELVPQLDASPLFADVSFLSAITKGRDGKERFRIGLRVDRANNAKP